MQRVFGCVFGVWVMDDVCMGTNLPIPFTILLLIRVKCTVAVNIVRYCKKEFDIDVRGTEGDTLFASLRENRYKRKYHAKRSLRCCVVGLGRPTNHTYECLIYEWILLQQIVTLQL